MKECSPLWAGVPSSRHSPLMRQLAVLPSSVSFHGAVTGGGSVAAATTLMLLSPHHSLRQSPPVRHDRACTHQGVDPRGSKVPVKRKNWSRFHGRWKLAGNSTWYWYLPPWPMYSARSFQCMVTVYTWVTDCPVAGQMGSGIAGCVVRNCTLSDSTVYGPIRLSYRSLSSLPKVSLRP